MTVTENGGARTLTFTDADLVVADPPELSPKMTAADVIFVPSS